MTDTIIFDIGNVLVEFGWKRYLKEVVPREPAHSAVEKAVFRSNAWVEHDKGLLTREEELQDFIRNAPEYEKEIRRVYETLGGCIYPLAYTVPWLKELKREGNRLYALSNFPEHIYDLREDKLDFLELMDGYILSFQEHLIKPDPAIFRLLTDRYGIDPARAVFLDDTPANVKAAEAFGIRGIHFRSLEQAREELQRLMKDPNAE